MLRHQDHSFGDVQRTTPSNGYYRIAVGVPIIFEAIDDVLLYTFDVERFRAFLAGNPALALGLIEVLTTSVDRLEALYIAQDTMAHRSS